MRTTRDRIRHAVWFEIIGLAIVTPLGALAFDMSLLAIGIVGLGCSVIATLWNYLYNLGFDHALRWLRGSVEKTIAIRVGHALLFEAGLLLILMPLIAWHLEISLWQAFLMDIAFAAFYVVYAFVYNWAYDRIFPLPPEPAG